jgi:hypothetical protein
MGPSTQGKADDANIAQQIAKLAEAIQALAERPHRPDDDRDRTPRRDLQRVDFGYQALGTLMGRVSRGSGAKFDVPVFAARWNPRKREILLTGLPEKADWIELRGGKKEEVLRVHYDRDDHHRSTEAQAEHGHDPERQARISPKTFAPTDAIDSVLGLRNEHGPVIALGPRIAPVPRYT